MMARPGNHIVEADNCPVCGESVNKRESVKIEATVYYFGHRYYLLSRRCKGNFLRDPDRYINRVDDLRSNRGLPGTEISRPHTEGSAANDC